ncbi:MAG: hypothetical protein H7834_02200 [Magnetococcus sp. YQC-9]
MEKLITRIRLAACSGAAFSKSRFANSAKRLLEKPKRRAAHFSQKTRKTLLLKSALKAKIKSKTLGEESPRPSLFFHH